jgi:multisubunit Na+/H+ antiporter MnhC subunit
MKIALYVVAVVVFIAAGVWAFLMPPLTEAVGEGVASPVDPLPRRIGVVVLGICISALCVAIASRTGDNHRP